VLDEVYSRLIERLRNMDAEERKKILSKIIEKYGMDGYRIYSNKEDEELVKKLTNMEYAGNINCVGGVIIESPDGSFRINMTFDELVKGIYEGKMKEISDMLFR
jgi:V/A-type H+-transporting ATPase subunit E